MNVDDVLIFTWSHKTYCTGLNKSNAAHWYHAADIQKSPRPSPYQDTYYDIVLDLSLGPPT